MSKSSSSSSPLPFVNSFVNSCVFRLDANAEFEHNANKLKTLLLTAVLGNSELHKSEFWNNRQDVERLKFYLQNLDEIKVDLKNKISELGEDARFISVIDETFEILQKVKNSERRTLGHNYILYGEQKDQTASKIFLNHDTCYCGQVKRAQYATRSSSYANEGEGTEITLGIGKYEGQWANGEKQGMGIYTFENGDRYAGHFEEGVKSGEGSFIKKDGSVMNGEWVNDQKEGRFSILSANSSQRFAFYHEGEEFVDELAVDATPSDVVRNSETRRDRFVSSFVNFCVENFNNNPNALTAMLLLAPLKGSAINSQIVWESMEEEVTSSEGQLKLYLEHLEAIEEKLTTRITAQESIAAIHEAFAVLRDVRLGNPQISDTQILYAAGKMIEIYKDGCYYGDAKEINQAGHGTKITSESKYVGEWLNGKYHGKGHYTYANGDMYDGEFQNHKFHGKGILHRNDETFKGSFGQGVKHGADIGTLFLPDQTVMKGRWINDKKQGLFEIISPGAHKKFSTYVDDEFLRDEPDNVLTKPAAGKLMKSRSAVLGDA